MKLYTKPRLTIAALLRSGDEIAFIKAPGGRPLQSEAAYVDADLSEDVTWARYHQTKIDDVTGTHAVTHTFGENDWTAGTPLIFRQWVELDPWSYVLPAEVNAQ